MLNVGENMPVLSIIGCKILEDEITHVLSEHLKSSRIILIDDLESMSLAKKLRSLNIPFSKTPNDRITGLLKPKKQGSSSKILSSISSGLFKSDDTADLVIVVKIMELGLHRDHHLLREGVEQQIVEMSAYSDGILLFYGLCGNALKDIEKIADDLECELYIPTDKDGQVVDDCVSIAVGGNRVYDSLFQKYSGTGTLFFTPMWAAKWDLTGDSTQDMLGKNCNSFFTEKIGRIVQVDTGLNFEKDFHENVSSASKHFDADIAKAKGSTEVIDSWYPKARDDLIKKTKKKSNNSDR